MGSMPAHVAGAEPSSGTVVLVVLCGFLYFVVTVEMALFTGALETSCLSLCRFMLGILCFVVALGVSFWVITLEISKIQVGT